MAKKKATPAKKVAAKPAPKSGKVIKKTATKTAPPSIMRAGRPLKGTDGSKGELS